MFPPFVFSHGCGQPLGFFQVQCVARQAVEFRSRVQCFSHLILYIRTRGSVISIARDLFLPRG